VEHKIGWALPLPATAEQVSAASQAQREEIIASYVKKLSEIQLEIKGAQSKLALLESDADRIHESRQIAYTISENSIKEQLNKLEIRAKEIQTQQDALTQRQHAHDQEIQAHNQNVKDFNAYAKAKEDQLEATRKELDEYATIQISTAERQKEVEESLKERCADIDQQTADCNKVIEKTIAEHHELKAAVAAHQVNIDAHIDAVKELELNQQKNVDYHNSLVSKERELEVLRKKCDEDMQTNIIEAKKIQDQNIEYYRIKREAEEMVKTATQTEQRAKAEIAKLEAIKKDIHSQLKGEA
jgi:hypothetical protein